VRGGRADLKEAPVGLAFLFAGQGSQSVGMGSALAATCADCRATLAAADRAADFPLSRIMAEGTAAELRRTAVAQPALLALAVAHARHLAGLGLAPAALAGHSLGQYAALVVAGALDLESAVRLVAARGRLMQETVPEGAGAMTAILGLERERVEAACAAARARGAVQIACYNAPGQTVISGAREAVAAASEACEEEGAGVVPLEVSAPFHSDLLAPMVPAFARLVEAAPVRDPELPVLDNVTARPLARAADVRRSLVAQVTAPVLFEESLRELGARGISRFVQCGPGKAVLGFAKRAAPGARLETFEEAAEARPLAEARDS
jgi:[acyl-carrier-protein] S-malonyltransferase